VATFFNPFITLPPRKGYGNEMILKKTKWEFKSFFKQTNQVKRALNLKDDAWQTDQEKERRETERERERKRER